MTRDLREAFISLVRLGIGHTDTTDIIDKVDWVALKALAAKQGLTAVVLDGIGTLQKAAKPSERVQEFKVEMPQKLRRQWIGEVIRFYENRYQQYEKAIGSLAGFYNQHGFKMMLLKGYACSLDWPKPNHRQCGDIDIWLFGKQKEADALLESLEFRVEGLEPVNKVQRIKIDNSHHHHTVFRWEGFSVENHYDFVNVYAKKSSKELEVIFKELGNESNVNPNVNFNDNPNDNDNSLKPETWNLKPETWNLKPETSLRGTRIPSVEVNGEKVYLPSPDLHALFLLKHTMMHFASEGIMLRQLLDWAFFVENHGTEVDWAYVIAVLDNFGMRQMFNIMNAICVYDLGFDEGLFPEVQYVPDMKDKVLNEILEPRYSASVPKDFFTRIVFKIRRWRDNRWKHRLCYNDSLWSAFWRGVWGHLLKPASI